ncbi:leucine-rich repeat-containing protein 72 [Epinephelus lanceolatus]|uniref:leucine-rich repeat-containing protein 72 n=1 Tax=Epinephelus lanceolatus TaxID=310571 RepID=UPI00144822A3|nr:leucine-rich repeat-containing protein 72 [Epinephelus lanceolatus]
MDVVEDIKESLQKSGIRRDVDVCQLSLATKKLTSVPDLSRFHFLRTLWLNNNKIKELSCRSINCCLTELYLHNNNIKSISGALNHLTCLRLLFLHNNQIRGLEDTMHELRRMQQLQTATFALNPISHEPGYRLHVIHCLPSVQVLDHKEVTSAERRQSFQMHSQERHRVLQSVAFCRRETKSTG